jgi:galactokinase
MVALVKPEAADNLAAAINERYPPASGRQATVYICSASEGVSEVSYHF